MNLTPSGWYGILAAIGAVVAAYALGFNAGRQMGRDEGFSDGKREGKKEGAARGYAVGFDRGKRHEEDGDEPVPNRPNFAFAMLGLILAGTLIFILYKMERGRVENREEQPVPIVAPSIDGQ